MAFPIFQLRMTSILASCLFSVIAAASLSSRFIDDATDHGRSVGARSPRSSFNGPAPLTILCIGDSITIGVGDGLPAGSHNGYRLDLLSMLQFSGIDPQFIGSQSSGDSNPQPLHEGFGWNTIDQIIQHMEEDQIMQLRPRLVLIHAGTNDDDFEQEGEKYVSAPDRLGNLIDFVLFSDLTAVILVAELIQNNYNQTQTNYFNSRVSEIVDKRLMEGWKVRMVDMSMIGGPALSDLLHPNVAGYAEMANRWYLAIMDIPDSWWLSL